MTDYISREAFVAEQRRLYCADCDRRKGTKNGKTVFCYEIGDAPCRACLFDDVLTSLEDYPAADLVEVEDAAKMLTWLFADHCPCNYNGIDEWLPYVCELSNECPRPKDELGCWKQFIKHHKVKMDGGADG